MKPANAAQGRGINLIDDINEKDRRISELEDEKASDGKMISWLNAQINDAQLRRSAQSDLEKFAF